MKKLKLATLIIVLQLIVFNGYAQYELITPPPHCGGNNVTISLDNSPEATEGFFGSCPNNPSITSYFYVEYTATGPSTPLITGIVPLSIANRSCEFTIEPTDWFNTTEIILKVQGYVTFDGGQTFVICPNAIQTFELTTAPTFPTIQGSTQATDLPTTYLVDPLPPSAGNIIYDWSFPIDWNITNTNTAGNEVDFAYGISGGVVGLTTIPEVTACNYPATLQVGNPDCWEIGITSYDFCNLENWSTQLGDNEIHNDEDKYPRMFGDFDGDGKDDLIWFSHDNVYVALSTGDSFAPVSSWTTGFTYGISGYTQTNYPRMIGDFDGDGKDDIIGFGQNETVVAISTGSSFSTSLFLPFSGLSYSDGFTNNNEVQRLIGDFNGDGKDDVVAFGYDAHDVILSTGNSFTSAPWTGSAAFSANVSGWNDYNRYPKLVGDFNGDGKDDIVGFGHNATIVGISSVNSFNISTWTTAFTYGLDGFEQMKYPRMVGDFNGDGKDDIIGFGNGHISVGESNDNNNGFTVSAWTGAFNPNSVRLDMRDIGYLDGGYHGEAFGNDDNHTKKLLSSVCIGDMNADGKDDLTVFGTYGVGVVFSNGDQFMCGDGSRLFANDIADQYGANPTPFIGYLYDHPSRILSIQQLDNTDPELEIVGLHVKGAIVLDCDLCDGDSEANFELVDFADSHQETGYSGWTANVFDYCNEDVKINTSTVTCEDRYQIRIVEFNLNTWTENAVLYESGWILNKIPDEFNLSSLVNFELGKLYMVSVIVGPQLNGVNHWLRLKNPKAILVAPAQATTQYTKAGKPYTVYQYCTGVLNTAVHVQGTNSSCYEKYRYQITQISPTTLNAIGAPVYQLPSGGGWNTGVIPNVNALPSTVFIQGNLYKVELFVEKDGVVSSDHKNIKRVNCVVGGKMSSETTSNTDDSKVYPNPSNGELINLITSDFGNQKVLVEVYSVDGKKIVSFDVESKSETVINLSYLNKGNYLINLSNDLKRETLRLTIQ